ncbi:DUF5988 family protein [Streptomyces sp. NPDC056534]|uniref:DUF5988 family protein n=1 Tax=Streptomyces sp. NPDC056534 TaxID=3345857 RepID=UPI00368C6510
MQNPAVMETRLVALEGGPESLHKWALVPAADTLDRVTLTHLNSREHFEFTGDYTQNDGQQAPVFRWIYTTRIAE